VRICRVKRLAGAQPGAPSTTAAWSSWPWRWSARLRDYAQFTQTAVVRTLDERFVALSEITAAA
jgi:hypothetical protein